MFAGGCKARILSCHTILCMLEKVPFPNFTLGENYHSIFNSSYLIPCMIIVSYRFIYVRWFLCGVSSLFSSTFLVSLKYKKANSSMNDEVVKENAYILSGHLSQVDSCQTLLVKI